MSTHASFNRQAFTLALPFTVIWASAFPATQFALRDCPPLAFLCLRFRLGLRDWLALALLAASNQAFYLGVSWLGMRQLSSGLATIIISASPILVALLAIPLLGERMTLRKLTGLLLGFGGVVFVVSSRIGHGGSDSLRGALLVGCALLILSCGTVLFKRITVPARLLGGLGLQTLLASAIMLPWSLATESWSAVQLSANTLGALLWCVAVVSMGGYLLWFALLRSADAGTASAWLFLTPPLGLLMGWLCWTSNWSGVT
jgi:drug/metabolite transporter (DMT)-like permease